MDLGLRGKVAMVAAASQGLGKAVALGFAREGANLAICSRNQAALEAVAAEARSFGVDVLAVPADLTRAEDIAKFVEKSIAHFGGIDILVTNAGGPPAGTFQDFADDAPWQGAFELTLLSAVRLIRGVLPSMRARGGGAIIVMTSSSIKIPIPNLILSNVFRAGVAALAKTLAEELAPYNIRVNNVLPGRIATERLLYLDQVNAERAGVSVEEMRQRTIAQIPMGRYGDPEEFANAVVFLASERASYITGASLQVDGGYIRCIY
ncbi:SDR family oxidoreductase [Thermomicrobium sp. 4228-Ro]|uniref:SDR family oxidoreductase n=1 Tax=Thermomicrobium sp. 4228-Ro TaxID=2993937 RepID=UPI002248C588|nr:SDR family oxidoreductase [Thermomicrobium sp. 4228-Ro]MCX2727995.1 SDR family oxidoreductase [Thermomicrobium sp. 4228-Ro]